VAVITPKITPRTIREWREREGITQVEAAERLNVSQQTYSSWERGAAYPRAAAELVVILAVGGFLTGALSEALDQWRERHAAES
jgi:DNA-binding transcriptional regulator YiaG